MECELSGTASDPSPALLSQVLKLCRKHRLLSALVYMFTRGLQDFIAPAVELLMAQLTESICAGTQQHDTPAGTTAASAGEADDTSSAGPGTVGESLPAASRRGADGYKLLVYLRCCLRGQQFPPGAGPLLSTQAGITKAATLGA